MEGIAGSFVRRPAVGIALSVVSGMLAGAVVPMNTGVFFCVGLVVFLCGWVLRNRRFSSALVFVFIALVSALRFVVSEPVFPLQNLPGVNESESVEIEGKINGSPVFYPYKSSPGGSWVFPVRCSGINPASEWLPYSGIISARILSAPERTKLYRGDRVLLKGKLEKQTYPGQPEFECVTRPADFKITGSARFSVFRLADGWRETASTRLRKGLENFPEQAAVLQALILGKRKEVPYEIMEPFRRIGAYHIFAISGLHVGIVGLLLTLVLKSIGIQRDRWGLFLLPLLFIYIVSTGMAASALRAFTMAAVYLLAPLFRRKADIPSSVAIAAILLLLIHPEHILNAGFIFSFTVVVFLIMVFAKVPEGWLKGRWIKTYCVSLVVSSFAANLASIPMTALYFGNFPAVSFIGNLLVVPLTFCIVVAGWLSVLLPFASAVFNYAALFFINILLISVNGLDRIPWSSWKTGPPPVMAVLLWYGCWIVFYTHAQSRRQKRYALAGIGFSVLLALL